MKIHAICPVDRNNIAIRETSCYCDVCRESIVQSECQWTVKPITKGSAFDVQDETRLDTDDQRKEPDTMTMETTVVSVNFKINDYVAAVYD